MSTSEDTSDNQPRQSQPVQRTHDNQQAQPQPGQRTNERLWPRLGQLARLFGYKAEDSIGDVRDALLTVAALMVTATYQAVLSPPGGLWQDDTNKHSAGKSIMASKYGVVFFFLMLFNSIGFYSSFYMIFCLTIKFPLQYPLVLLSVSISVTYSISMISIIPSDDTHLIMATGVAIGFGFLVPWIPSIVRSLQPGESGQT